MLLVYYTRNLIDGVYRLKIVTQSMSQLCLLKTFFELTINYILFYEMIIDVVQFCNGNCSVAKVIVPPGKGKQEHVKSTNSI